MSGRIDLAAVTKTGVKAYINRGIIEAVREDSRAGVIVKKYFEQ